jgi:hypothetical protein
MNNNAPLSCPCKPDQPMKKYQSVDYGPIFGCRNCGYWCEAVFPLKTFSGIVMLWNGPDFTQIKMAPHHGEPSLN